MKLTSTTLFVSASLILTSCATAPSNNQSAAEERRANREQPTAATGSHMRHRTKKAQATVKMSGDDFQRENAANRIDTSADKILQSRN